MRHSARHRARRRGILRRRILPRGLQSPGFPSRSGPRRGPAAAALAAAIGVIALVGGSPAAAATHGPAAIAPVTTAGQVPPPAAPPVRARQPVAVVVSCAQHRVVVPRALVITCADANDYLTRLKWMSWGSVAFGRGVEHINDCTPYCAAGHFRAYPVLVTLWRAEPQAHHSGLRFTRLTELYTGRRPVEYTAAGRPYRPRTVTRRL